MLCRRSLCHTNTLDSHYAMQALHRYAMQAPQAVTMLYRHLSSHYTVQTLAERSNRDKKQKKEK
uniref:Uncharacterized protein n=1 Tax=Arion vulgaris TaxID=1028688 RepID=A0A0B7C3H2_9EUPU